MSVVHENNIYDLEEIVCAFYEKGLKEFSLLPLLDFDEKNKGKLLRNTKVFAEKIWDLNLKLYERYYFNRSEAISQRDVALCFHYLVQSERSFMCNRGPCGAGINIISISPKGEVYPCFGFQSIKEFLLGNINDLNFVFSRIHEKPIMEELRRRNDSIEDCKECDYNIWCYGGCPSNAFLGIGNIKGRDIIRCTINKYLIKRSLEYIIENKEENSYIKNIAREWRK